MGHSGVLIYSGAVYSNIFIIFDCTVTCLEPRVCAKPCRNVNIGDGCLQEKEKGEKIC